MRAVTVALALIGVSLTSPSYAGVCLNVRDIDNAYSHDGKVMQFHMRDGETYINHLQGNCPDLRFSTFFWVIRGPEEVCENMQSLRVLQSGEICVLGKFDAPISPSS